MATDSHSLAVILRAVRSVFIKEWLDLTRDIKGILPVLLMPILFALTSFGALHFIVGTQKQSPSFTLAVSNAHLATPLIQQLNEHGIETRAFTGDDPVVAVTSGEEPMVLHLPEQFNENFRQQNVANAELIWNLSRTDQQATANKIKSIAHNWFATIGAQRLILQGISPQAAQVGQIVDINTAKDQQMAMRILGSVPLFLVIVALIASAGIATEMAAGEREGRTLEALLSAPVPTVYLFIGKWLTAVSLSLVIMVFALIGQYLAIYFAPTAELGLRLSFSFSEFASVFIILLPLVLLANSLLLCIAFRARSLKDSQTYTQLMTLLPTATGLYVLINGEQTDLQSAAIPLLGSQSLITDALSGTSGSFELVMLNALANLLLAAIFGVLAIKAFKI